MAKSNGSIAECLGGPFDKSLAAFGAPSHSEEGLLGSAPLGHKPVTGEGQTYCGWARACSNPGRRESDSLA